MLHALVTMATEEGGASHAPFYILGALLAAFAVVLAGVGIARKETFPPSAGAQRAVMGFAAVLVVAVCATAVVTA